MAGLKLSARAKGDASNARTACIVLPIFSGEALKGAAKTLDAATDGALGKVLALKDFSAASGQSSLLPGAGKAERILLVGCGKRDAFDDAAAREFCRTVYSALNTTRSADAVLLLDEMPGKKVNSTRLLETLARTLVTGAYRYTETVSEPQKALALSRVSVSSPLAKAAAQKALDTGAATGNGINAARNLANLPANICTPSYLASEARKLARGNNKLNVQVVDEKRMRELGMDSFLSVTAGTTEPARLIIVNYRGGKKSDKPYVFVGKGITFDSGGISIKPAPKMDEMKFDMGGAASVMGTMTAVAELELPLNVIGVIAAAENMPSGNATKPGDVVKSMSGKTIEILNTDAEGRLVLCDTLTYVERFKPEVVIDIATLTGACVVALGSHACGLYSNTDALADALLAAGSESHDRAWRMPLWDDYTKQLQSNFADLGNIGSPGGGSVTAACFLAEFAKDYTWAHLDIAGVAWDASPKWATGRPVGLLTRYLLDRAGK